MVESDTLNKKYKIGERKLEKMNFCLLYVSVLAVLAFSILIFLDIIGLVDSLSNLLNVWIMSDVDNKENVNKTIKNQKSGDFSLK